MGISGIIAGLGNPGPGYARTRHNAGFMVIDRLIASQEKIPGDQVRLKSESRDVIVWEWTSSSFSGTWLLLKPLTFMNRSGTAVSRIYSRTMLEIDRLLIVHDEVDLPLGSLRFKQGGGLAGHNGLRSIASHLGTRDFARLRFGVGRPEDGADLADYVLSKFSPAELELKDSTVEKAVHGLRIFCSHGLEKAGTSL
ncbi:aminoacyl-tRNA hydrolase [Desulfonatronovibrio hydrogenovorans]|uniref:aminoacyl-tRNA hydrolase n=1 Tax=Desulfonatronovibrio hydrogenovorans TaxID=53245 RepID=UPI00048D439B|nr:aminoacyl-tRNA hydrolase [Desulfonatronovibrio hydrogenovorans]